MHRCDDGLIDERWREAGAESAAAAKSSSLIAAACVDDAHTKRPFGSLGKGEIWTRQRALRFSQLEVV